MGRETNRFPKETPPRMLVQRCSSLSSVTRKIPLRWWNTASIFHAHQFRPLLRNWEGAQQSSPCLPHDCQCRAQLVPRGPPTHAPELGLGGWRLGQPGLPFGVSAVASQHGRLRALTPVFPENSQLWEAAQPVYLHGLFKHSLRSNIVSAVVYSGCHNKMPPLSCCVLPVPSLCTCAGRERDWDLVPPLFLVRTRQACWIRAPPL